MSIILFWTVTITLSVVVFFNFILMFALEKGTDRGIQATAFLLNSMLLAYVLFFSKPI